MTVRLYLDAAPVIYTVEQAPRYAAAVISRCDVFLTNDHRLDRFLELAVEILQP